jgi:hypothetical protein
MVPFLIVALIGAVAFAFFEMNRRTQLALQVQAERTQLDEMKRELSSLKSLQSKHKGELQAREGELKKTRDELKEARQRAADAKSKKKAEPVTATASEPAAARRAAVGIEEAREQMALALSEAANLRNELQKARAELKTAKANRAPAPAEVEAASPAPAAAADNDGARQIEEHYRGEMHRLRASTRAKVDELKASFDQQFGREREKFREEAKTLRTRNKRLVLDLERERRRAENTDRAYLILRSQLEASLDRLAAWDPDLRRPEDPIVRPPRVEAPEAPVTETPVVAAVETQAPQIAVAETPASPAPVVETAAPEAPAATVAPATVEAPAATEAPAEPAESLPAPPIASAPEAAPRRPSMPAMPALVPAASLGADDGWGEVEELVQKRTSGEFKAVE